MVAKKATTSKKQSSKSSASASARKSGLSVNVYGVDGKTSRKVVLPGVFRTEYRPDLIRKAVKSYLANRRQAYGPGHRSGLRHSVSTWGKGRGVARVQRLKDGRTGAESPPNVGGRRSHPPTPARVLTEKMNRKERSLARRSAIAALRNKDLVTARGHRFDGSRTTPIVVVDAFEEVATTKSVLDILDKLGVMDDVVRAEHGKHIRAGRGKMRGRKYHTPRSVLIIVSPDAEVAKSARNLIGVDVTSPEQLNTYDLAPGGDAGRLVIMTESALSRMEGW